jgi:hypothetical protein
MVCTLGWEVSTSLRLCTNVDWFNLDVLVGAPTLTPEKPLQVTRRESTAAARIDDLTLENMVSGVENKRREKKEMLCHQRKYATMIFSSI